jgi:cell shape-determining protein MreC
MAKIALEDTNKYIRDGDSKAIVSTDRHELAAYNAQRERLKQMKSYGTEIIELKNEMTEIKSLLKQILTNHEGRKA